MHMTSTMNTLEIKYVLCFHERRGLYGIDHTIPVAFLEIFEYSMVRKYSCKSGRCD